ncbi:HepT-like ribonuclease domain-containing protein [Desulfothermus naphthae]
MEGKLFSKYPSIDRKGIKRMRDIISHHYFDVDIEIIYEVCKNKMPELKDTIEEILKDI